MKDDKSRFWTARVSMWHIAYIVLICLLIVLFVLLIAPGRINDDAYHNFSFAATITSIVLAVVSIVYSIQSGLSSLRHMGRIRDIEEQISEEVNKFSGIDEAIRKAISPISQAVGDIQKAQDSMKQTQDDLLGQVTKISETKVELKQVDGKQMTIVGPQVLYVVLYAAAMSKEKDMDVPFHKFYEVLGQQSRYCEGLLDGLAALNPDNLKVEQGSRNFRKRVTIFNEAYFGSKDYWKSESEKIDNDRIAKGLISRIDDYYSDKKNQNPHD